VVTAPTGINLQYSIGGAFQASGTFAGLTPNTYNVTVKDNVTGCVSVALPLTVNAPPGAPVTPTGSVTVQPDCIVTTGTIVVTAPTGANLQYSIGGAYQTSGTFTGLAPNTYTVNVKDIVSGCVSGALQLIVNPVAGAPATPTASVTVQPGCVVGTGTIVITAPTGPNLQYSIGGVYQTSGTFTGLVPNTYILSVKDIVTGCVSSPQPLTVNAMPAPPATATAGVTVQPTCTAPTGTIVVTAPIGANLQYSIGGAYQGNVTFSGLLPNNYNLTVKDIVSGCVSAILPLTVNVVPGAPATPTASVTIQPTCPLPTGTIVVTAPTSANIEYSIGGVYQASATFSGLAPNTYTITAKDNTTGCISPGLILIINPIPGLPAAPVTTTDSRCGPGIVNLTANGTGALAWYSDAGLINHVADGVNFSPTINATTTYYVTATNNNCTSAANPVTATIHPLPAPDLGNNRSICQGDVLILNPGIFNSYIWQDNTVLPTYRVTAAGLYSVLVKDASGCENTAVVSISAADCNDIYFPSAFTPNGDTKNDDFGPLPYTSISLLKDYTLSVYNRYGQLIFKSRDPNRRWSGKFLEMITAGSYTWYASYTFRGVKKEKKGNILVIR